MPNQTTKEEKDRVRKEKNKMYARYSRKKTKDRLDSLTKENRELCDRVKRLELSNRKLRLKQSFAFSGISVKQEFNNEDTDTFTDEEEMKYALLQEYKIEKSTIWKDRRRLFPETFEPLEPVIAIKEGSTHTLKFDCRGNSLVIVIGSAELDYETTLFSSMLNSQVIIYGDLVNDCDFAKLKNHFERLESLL